VATKESKTCKNGKYIAPKTETWCFVSCRKLGRVCFGEFFATRSDEFGVWDQDGDWRQRIENIDGVDYAEGVFPTKELAVLWVKHKLEEWRLDCGADVEIANQNLAKATRALTAFCVENEDVLPIV